MSNDSPQIQALRARYRESFPEKMAVIDGCLENLKCLFHEGDDQAIKQEFDVIHAELHKFAGSFGMYNYQDIATVCRDAMTSISSRDTQLVLDLLTKLSAMIASHNVNEES